MTFLGRIEIAQKGLDLFLQAIAKITDDEGWKYVIAGKGVDSEEERLRRIMNKLHLEKKVQLIGKVTGDAKTKLMEETSIMVVPSRFETFSMVSLEAQSYALPLVTFNIEGLQWLPQDGVVQSPAFDTDDLAQQIQALEQNDQKRLAMGKANMSAVAKYGWNQVIPRYKAVIRELL